MMPEAPSSLMVCFSCSVWKSHTRTVSRPMRSDSGRMSEFFSLSAAHMQRRVRWLLSCDFEQERGCNAHQIAVGQSVRRAAPRYIKCPARELARQKSTSGTGNTACRGLRLAFTIVWRGCCTDGVGEDICGDGGQRVDEVAGEQQVAVGGAQLHRGAVRVQVRVVAVRALQQWELLH